MNRSITDEMVTGSDILIVEDSPTQAEFIRTVLEKHNYQVRVASDGNKALSMMNESKPEVIITDVLMKGMDGYTLCREAKEDDRYKNIPIIVLTSLTDTRDVIKGLESGADAFITKPYNESYLIDRIEHLKQERNEPRCLSIPKEMAISIDGERHIITSDRRQILNLFLSAYEVACQRNSELQAAQKELRQLSAKLAAANKELETFNYSIAHDLRNPLTKISGYTQVVLELSGDRIDEQCKDYLKEVFEATVDMSDLISVLLDFSKMPHAEINREIVNISNLANLIAVELKMTNPDRKVVFKISEGITVNGDKHLMLLLMQNLLSNAWKYTALKKEALIEFGMTTVAGKTTYYVRDNGTGFDMNDAHKLFIPFKRLHNTSEFKGHGIGLSTVQRIIKCHKGRIWAEGAVGKGATFYFTL